MNRELVSNYHMNPSWRELKEEDIFEKHLKFRRALIMLSNAYISVSDNFKRKNRREQLDKIINEISSLRL